MNGLGLMALRLVLAVVFIAHGGNILFGLWAGPAVGVGGPEPTAQILAAVGIEPNFPLAVLAGILSTVGGLLLAIGWLTRYAAPVLAVMTLVALWKVHLQWGFFINWTGAADRGQGVELHVVVIGALIGLALTGAGDWSVDVSRETSAASRAAGRARLRGKI